jgi:heptosyltransferase-1
MHILLLKTSSLGDVIHNLPVVSDLRRSFPAAGIDWCVEESFADIPRLHPAVGEVIPLAIRRWRRQLDRIATWREMRDFRQRLRSRAYDFVLDTQGLVKSALVSRLAHGRRLGYAAEAARESFAAHFYDDTFVIPRNVHAVQRNRWLAAAALDYPVDLPLDYGISPPAIDISWLPAGPFAVLLTATSRDDKLWQEGNWHALGCALSGAGVTAVLPAGNARERERAERIATAVAGAVVAPPLRLRELAALLARASIAIGVDTGLAHLAAALCIPVIAIYVATDPALTGVFGDGFISNLGNAGRPPEPAAVIAAAERVLRR